jgi:hypothetical protein
MAHRPSWLKFLASSIAVVVFVLGAAVPAALAKKPSPPKNTQLPNGRPFQLIQEMIDGLDARIDALEAAAPKAGTMWINPLAFTGTAGTVDLATVAATPGLVVSAAAAAADTLQAGLQVPLGFAITGATVCYAPGASGGFVSSIALAKNNQTPPFASSSLPTGAAIAVSPGTPTCEAMTLDTPYDPSDGVTGGPAYLAIGVSFSAVDLLTIRGIAVLLEPIAEP